MSKERPAYIRNILDGSSSAFRIVSALFGSQPVRSTPAVTPIAADGGGLYRTGVVEVSPEEFTPPTLRYQSFTAEHNAPLSQYTSIDATADVD